MAILNIYLNIDNEYINLIKDIYKVLVILIVFQILVSLSTQKNQKNIITIALTGCLLNDDFMIILIFAIISISSYYLIFDRLLSIE